VVPLTSRLGACTYASRGRDAEGSQFERLFVRRTTADDGSASLTRRATELSFSAPPSALDEGDECDFDVRVSVHRKRSGSDETRTFERSFPCRVQTDGAARVITVPGMETADELSLPNAPYSAARLWGEYLESELDAALSDEARRWRSSWPKPPKTRNCSDDENEAIDDAMGEAPLAREGDSSACLHYTLSG
jgi:hypothetical protein